MHVYEGWLPIEWCGIWFVLSVIVVIIGILQMKKVIHNFPEAKKLIAVNGLWMFILSFIRFPLVKGSYSHPTLNGISGSLFGPAITSVIVAVVLLVQALVFAYGGLTTLGANIFSIGVVGPFVAYVIFCGLNKVNCPSVVSLVFAVFFANFATSLTTAVQFALVYGDFYKFLVLFLVGQIPMAIADVIVSAVLFVALKSIFDNSELFSNDSFDFLRLR